MTIEATISGADQFTDWAKVRAMGKRRGQPDEIDSNFHVSVYDSSAWSGTLHAQIRETPNDPIRDVPDITFDDVCELNGTLHGAWEIRVGCKTGNYTAGSIKVRIK